MLPASMYYIFAIDAGNIGMLLAHMLSTYRVLFLWRHVPTPWERVLASSYPQHDMTHISTLCMF